MGNLLKFIFALFFICFSTDGLCQYQGLKGGLTVNVHTVTVDSDSVRIKITIFMDMKNFSTRRSVIYIPELVTTKDSCTLPLIFMSGKRSKKVAYRNYEFNTSQDSLYRIIDLVNGVRLAELDYSLKFEPWMEGSQLYIREVQGLYGHDKHSVNYYILTIPFRLPPSDLDLGFMPRPSVNCDVTHLDLSWRLGVTHNSPVLNNIWLFMSSQEYLDLSQMSTMNYDEMMATASRFSDDSLKYETIMRNILRYYPDSVAVKINVAGLDLLRGDVLSATTLLDEIKEEPRALNNLGVLALLQKKPYKATHCFFKASKVSSDALWNFEQLMLYDIK